MAQICIITAQGMKCDSSPMKLHYGGAKKCRQVGSSQARMDREIHATVEGVRLSRARQTVIDRVVRLMVRADVKDDTVFTIVKAEA